MKKLKSVIEDDDGEENCGKRKYLQPLKVWFEYS